MQFRILLMGRLVDNMPKKAKELSAIEVTRLTDEGLHAVGGVAGLCLQVSKPNSFDAAPTTARSWVLRITIGSKRREMGLGGYPDVTLAQAKEKAREARAKADQGIDPVLERKEFKSALIAEQAKAVSFEQAAIAYITAHESGWKNIKHAQQWRNSLTEYAYPTMGKMLVRDIQTAHVIKVLEPIWTTKTETASRVQQRMARVLDWAKARGYRTGDNPAQWRGHLDMLLPAPNKVSKVEHHAALPYDQTGDFMAALRQQQGVGARALEFTILTATRSGEVRLATWEEIDLHKAVWIIPAERMKAGKEHHVPLSPPAVALLKSMPRIDGGEIIFPGMKGKAMSDSTLAATLERMGRDDLTVHGFRSTFRDWAGEVSSYPREVIEHAMAHQLADKAEAAYQRGSLFDKRRALMNDWAKYCAKPSVKLGGNVTQIRKAG